MSPVDIPRAPSNTAADTGSAGVLTREASARSLTLVVPLFNESSRFASYAPELRDFIESYVPYGEIVFVDDGSSDDTARLVQRFIEGGSSGRMRLLRRTHLGKGAAVAAGLAAARTELAAFCDLDLATPLTELERIVDAAARAQLLAIGSRGATSSSITRRQSPGRELLGRSYNRAVQLSLVPGIVDTQCGAKAAPTGVWNKILPLCGEEGFAWDVEVIAVSRALGVTVQEIGIEWRHQAGSRVHPLRDGVKMLQAIPRIRRRLRTVLRVRSKADTGGGAFADQNATALAEADTSHWWFRNKATFVSLLMRRYAPKDGWLIDVGAGPGGVTAMLGWAPDRSLALEGNPELVVAARRRHALFGVAGDAASIPLGDSTSNVVCLLDVIEHISDPVPTIREAARILTPEGRLIVNVPAHPLLWSAADEVLGHARRYTTRRLRQDLEQGGFEVLWMSHVFSWLFVPVWLRRRATPGRSAQLGLDVESSLINLVSMLLTRIEWAIVSLVPLPVGTSLLCVCARREKGPPGSA